MKTGQLNEVVLVEIARQQRRIGRRPRPEPWRRWAVDRDQDDRTLGPRYSPSWFGEAAATEAGRVRHLRAVYALADCGLVQLVKSEGGRLERVRLTPAGRKAAAASAAAGGACPMSD
jgi:hypothetical protein